MSFYSTLGIICLLGAALWFWRDSLGAREQARLASAKACRQLNLQLLDDTVALQRLWLRRDALDGRLRWERLYIFEFSSSGEQRQVGSVLLLGSRVQVLHIEGGDLLLP